MLMLCFQLVPPLSKKSISVVLNVIFRCCEHHKQDSVHLQCISLEKSPTKPEQIEL